MKIVSICGMAVALLLVAGPALAYTQEETETLKLFAAFDNCRADKLEATNPDEIAKEIHERSVQKGNPQDENVVKAMIPYVAQIKAREACVAEMKIDEQDFIAKLEALELKYGSLAFAALTPG